jgi:hypothetical protein
MRYLPLLALIIGTMGVSFGAAPTDKVQKGRLSTVTLLATQRVASEEAPDGMRFLFLIRRASEVAGSFTLKETRDFDSDGESYQEKTQAALGKKFAPSAIIDRAESFFTKQPNLRHLAPDDIADTHVLLLTIVGAPLNTGANVDVTLHVGYGKEVEAFTFATLTPPKS